MKIFGFEIKREGTLSEYSKKLPSFSEPINDQGAITVGGAVGGSYGIALDLNGAARTESELITRYRQMLSNPEIQQAVDEVVNELVSVDSENEVVKIVLDRLEISPKVKKIIEQEFKNLLKLLDFSNNAYDIAQKFYVDGRLNYHLVVDPANPKEGIVDLRYLDPRKVRLVREVEDRLRQTTNHLDPMISAIKSEYYIYSDDGFGSTLSGLNTNTGSGILGLKIAKDSIARITSGIINEDNTAVLSHLHPAFKPLNQLRMLEDASVIYTMTRAPERRIFYVDVGSLPKAKAEQYLYEFMARHKNKVTYNPETGNVVDDRKMMCYDLGTKIPLLDGRTLELREIIAEHKEGKQNWVYSCDPVTGKFYPGPVSWAGITKRNAQVVKITFDNGKSVTCTPDHKFPVWGKGFVEAQHLTKEDSIISGYRKEKKITSGGIKYEQIYKNETKTWEFTHREVSKWKDENGISESMVFSQEYADKLKTVIHHKNFNNKDNSPDNLIKMLSETRKQKVYSHKTWSVTTPNNDKIVIENLSRFCRDNGLNRSNIKTKFGSGGYHAEILRNHKMISVEFLDEKIDVGSMSIDREETYHSHHTYLLDAGVYTKNTMTEDYWFPRREGNRTTEVDTLPSSGSLLSNDSLIYFQTKLFKSLNVPIGRLQPENMYALGRSNETTREEFRFAKMIRRIRSRFSVLFDICLERQLILKEIISPEEWEEIKDAIAYDFVTENFFEEMKEVEILRERVATAKELQDMVGTYFSETWIKKKVLKMTDSEIEENDAQLLQDLQKRADFTAAAQQFQTQPTEEEQPEK